MDVSPELMQRSEVAAAELEHWCGGAKEEMREKMIKTRVPIYKGVIQGMRGNRGGRNHHVAIWTPRFSGCLLR